MSSEDKSKKGYEPVPDVELGTGPSVNQQKAAEWAKQNYPELALDDQQARLLGTMDEVMKHAKLELNLPVVSPQDLQTTAANGNWWVQAKAYVYGMMQPTVTAIITFCAALYLEAQQRAQSVQENGQQKVENAEENFMDNWGKYAVLLFPYVNATLVFAATARPILERSMAMIQPVFNAMDHAEEKLQSTVKRLGPFVDNSIDGIQKDYHTVLEPIKPSLDQINSKAHLLEQVFENRGDADEDFDIPDPSDIDRELDEAQGIVTDKIDEAQKHLQVDNYMPSYLDSPRQFFWRVVFPVAFLAWIIQMTVAFGTERLTHRKQMQATPGNRRVLLGFDLGSISAVEPTESNTDIRNADYWSQMKDNAHNETDNFRSQAHNQYGHYSDLANSTMHSIRDNVTNMLHGYERDFEDQYNQYKGEFDTAMAQSKSLVQDVIVSYIVALLQMLFIYIVTSQAVQTWVVRQGMRQVQKGAERTLEEYGVSQALDEVLGQRLGRVRQKILKLLRIYKKVQHTLEEAGAMANYLPTGSAEQVAATLSGEAVQNAIAQTKKGKFFGRLFGKK